MSSRTHIRLSAQVIAERWCILCWVCGWRLTVLVSPSDVIVMRGCQIWSSMACPGTCCPGMILSTTMFLPMSNYFLEFCKARVKRYVICPFSFWWLLRWCRSRETGVGFLHRLLLSFHLCKAGVYMSCNLIFIF